MKFAEYESHDALGLAALVRSGQVGAAELLETAIARTDAVDGALNAVVLRHDEFARAQIAAGLPDGPFTGVPFLLKDLFIDLDGTTTTNGSVFLRDTVARRDSTVATRYKKAGLVIFGKTHSPEFGNSPTTESQLWGATLNPWNRDVTPGGSSGGASAAVSAGIVPFANASDAGGSIRGPAAVTGLFGLKPSRGRVPLGPARFDGGGGIAVLHAITRSVRDSAALLDATAGAEPGALYGSPQQERPFLDEVGREPGKLRIAIMRTGAADGPVAPECLAALDDAARLCESLGHHVEEATPVLDIEAFNWARLVVFKGAAAVSGIRGNEKAWGRKAGPGDFEPATWKFFEEGLKVSGDQVLAAREVMFQLHRQMAEFLTRYDLILTPTLPSMPVQPGTIDLSHTDEATQAQAMQFTSYTAFCNLSGQPSMSVPLYWTPDNMPVGVMFSGRFGEEGLLYRLAGQLEQARPWFHRRPPQWFVPAS